MCQGIGNVTTKFRIERCIDDASENRFEPIDVDLTAVELTIEEIFTTTGRERAFAGEIRVVAEEGDQLETNRLRLKTNTELIVDADLR